MTNTAAIATKLNVLESAIVRVEEWFSVLFVVVKGLGARFVSKRGLKMNTRIATIKKYGNDIKIDIVGKGYKRITQQVTKNCEFNRHFDDLTVDQKQAIKQAAKFAYEAIETATVDLNTLEINSIGFVPSALTGYRSASMRREDWQKEQEIKAEKAFDLEYEMYDQNGRYYG